MAQRLGDMQLAGRTPSTLFTLPTYPSLLLSIQQHPSSPVLFWCPFLERWVNYILKVSCVLIILSIDLPVLSMRRNTDWFVPKTTGNFILRCYSGRTLRHGVSCLSSRGRVVKARARVIKLRARVVKLRARVVKARARVVKARALVVKFSSSKLASCSHNLILSLVLFSFPLNYLLRKPVIISSKDVFYLLNMLLLFTDAKHQCK
jgi:hypothetical protein